MSRELLYSDLARKSVFNGIEKVYKAVATTLGASGRNVMYDSLYDGITITKDGVSVAKEIELKDPFENIGVQFVKEVASKTNDSVGDGTSSTVVLTYAIVKEGLKAISSGARPIRVQRGIEKASKILVEKLKDYSRSVANDDDIKNVASISANNDSEIGILIAEAISKVGKDGVITVEESKNMETTVKVTDGYQIREGYQSAYFMKQQGQKEINFEDAYVLLYDGTISANVDLIPILEQVAKTGKPVVIISDRIEGEALTTLVMNNMRGTIHACAIKAPSIGDNRIGIMEDLAVITGATYITENLGLSLKNTKLEQLGRVKSVKINKDSTTILNGYGNKEDVTARANSIREKIDELKKSDSDSLDIDRLKDRLANLTGGVAVIEIGAITETEMKEKKFRIEDTLSATRAALEEGIVAGGGVTLLLLGNELDSSNITNQDEKIGFDIMKEACKVPIKQIVENAGVSGDVVVHDVLEKNNTAKLNSLIGYDANELQYVDLFKTGIIDPTKVTRCVIQNASSIAGMILTTECVMANVKDEDNNDSSVPNTPMLR